jgi:hypothetical protein
MSKKTFSQTVKLLSAKMFFFDYIFCFFDFFFI